MAKSKDEPEVVVYRFQRTFQSWMEPSLSDDRLHEPLVDIYETKDELVVEVELPGVEKEDIDAYTIHNRLYLRAFRNQEVFSGSAPTQYLCMERIFGEFYREIELPVACDTGQAKARFENGVLVIKFPKITERRGKRKEIKIE